MVFFHKWQDYLCRIPKESTKKPPELLSLYNKFGWYMVRIEKSIAHSNNKWFEFENLKCNAFTLKAKIIK